MTGSVDPGAHVPRRLHAPDRLLLGPGPSNVDARVRDAMAQAAMGHLDPYFLSALDEISAMLRYCFQTSNALTFAVSGTGSAGMEAAFVNLLSPGDEAVICVNGVFGARMAEVATRASAKVVTVDAEWGSPVEAAAMSAILTEHPHARLVAVVHAETSTGVESDVAAIGAAVREHAPDAFFVVDAVTSLAGVELRVDAWGIDVCYAGTQKCLSVPPGLAPITFNSRAVRHVEAREVPVQSWYLDISLIGAYLDASTRTYHHTAPTAALAGLHEGLRIVVEEGLESRWTRHAAVGARLRDELESRGFGMFAADGHRLAPLTSVLLPDGIDDVMVRSRLRDQFGIEVGPGLGPWAGRMWRIGLMGTNAVPESVDRFLDALDEMGIGSTPGPDA